MPCLITALTRSFIEKIAKKNKQQKKQKQNFHGKNKYKNLNAPNNNAKMQSSKTSMSKIYFVHIIQQMAIFLNEIR